MNLIQIQENLKDLPIDVIKSYANGQNPEVPPYMALGELERRSRSEQRKVEPPTQSVKEKLEAQVGAPQGMPQGMPQAAPEGIAQLQGMPPGMPQAAPVMAAAGGLMDLPVPDDMFNYAPGGIVAFAGGGEPGEETAGEAEARANMAAADQSQGPPASAIPPAGLQALAGPAIEIIKNAMAGQSNIPMPVDPEQAKAEAIKRDPRLAAILNKIPGESYVALIEKLKAQNQAGKAQFQDSQSRMGLGALGDALIAAGEATRGQKGFGAAFAGFGKSYGASSAEKTKRQQAQQALERQQEIELAKLQSDIDNLQMAYATGDMEKISKYKQAVADRQAKIEGNRITAAKEGVSLGMEETKMRNTADHYAAVQKNEAARLAEMIRNNDNQASIERQKLKVQEAIKNSQLALDRERLDALIESRPTAEQKIIRSVEANLAKPNTDFSEANKRIALLQPEELDAPIGKYYRAIRDKAREDAYKRAKLPPPDKSDFPLYESFQPAKPKEEPGFLDRMFGSSPAPKVIKLD